MIASFLADYDYNLPLRDAEGDPELSLRRRTMAAIGCHVGLDSGYYDAQALAACLLAVARVQIEDLPLNQGETRDCLYDLLGRDNLGYQQALYRLVATASAADAAADLVWLTELMRQRAGMAPVARDGAQHQAVRPAGSWRLGLEGECPSPRTYRAARTIYGDAPEKVAEGRLLSVIEGDRVGMADSNSRRVFSSSTRKVGFRVMSGSSALRASMLNLKALDPAGKAGSQTNRETRGQILEGDECGRSCLDDMVDLGRTKQALRTDEGSHRRRSRRCTSAVLHIVAPKALDRAQAWWRAGLDQDDQPQTGERLRRNSSGRIALRKKQLDLTGASNCSVRIRAA